MSIVRATPLLAGLLLLPAVLAGTASSPELTDASGDAPGPVDVLSAWIAAAPPAPARTGVVVDQAGERVDVDCTLFVCRDAVAVTVKLRDFAAAAPLADADPNSLRYHYSFTFTPDVWGAPVTVRCVISGADLGVSSLGTGSPRSLLGVGTLCQIDAGGATGEAFDVASTHFSYLAHRSEDTTLTNTYVDRVAGTFTVTLIEDLADIGPGTVFSDLTVTTSIGTYATSPPNLFRETPGDSAGPAAASFTL